MYFVISDIHGCITRLQMSINKFEQSSCKYLLILGDILNHGPRNPLVDEYNPKACIELLNLYRNKIIAVRGNCDSEVDQMVLKFPMMADLSVIHLGDRRVIASHGHLYDPLANDGFFAEGDIYLFGHTHVPMAKNCQGKILLNPGSITLPKENNAQSFAILSNQGFDIYNFNDEVLRSIKF